jgi:hypothetical protein
MVRSLTACSFTACAIAFGSAAAAPAWAAPPASAAPPAAAHCLPSGDGYFRATVAGAVDSHVDWPDQGTRCEGESRESPPGVRLSFHRDDSNLLFVLGLTGIRQGHPAREVGANLTLIVQGTDRIYGTLGDSRCTIDSLSQKPLGSSKDPSKTYRVEARGFCTQPAHAVRGDGAVLVSTFEFAGLVNYDPEPGQDIKGLIPQQMTPVK